MDSVRRVSLLCMKEKRRAKKALELKKSAEDRLAQEQEKSVRDSVNQLDHF